MKKYFVKNLVIIFVSVVVLFLVVMAFLIWIKRENSKKMISLANDYFSSLKAIKDYGEEVSLDNYQGKVGYVIRYPSVLSNEIDEVIIKRVNEEKDSFLSRGNNVKDKSYLFMDYEAFSLVDDVLSIVLYKQVRDRDNVYESKIYTYNFSLEKGNLLREEDLFIGNYQEKIREVITDYMKENKGEFTFKDHALSMITDFKYVLLSDKLKFYFLKNEMVVNDEVQVEISYEKMKDVLNKEIFTMVEAETKDDNGKPTEGDLVNRGDVEITINGERKIDPSKPMVALTFDDGPNSSSTTSILDTLERYGVVATFFDLGKLAERYPDIVRREEQIGCEVGTHTYNHPNLNKMGEGDIKNEMEASKRAFTNVLGHDVKLLRPPYGNANSLVRNQVDYGLINWDVDSLDWKNRNKEAILSKIREYGNLDGRIILMHSIYKTTAEAVSELVPELINNGYQLVTISEMAKYKGKTIEKGRIIYNFK